MKSMGYYIVQMRIVALKCCIMMQSIGYYIDNFEFVGPKLCSSNWTNTKLIELLIYQLIFENSTVVFMDGFNFNW